MLLLDFAWKLYQSDYLWLMVWLTESIAYRLALAYSQTLLFVVVVGGEIGWLVFSEANKSTGALIKAMFFSFINTQ